MLDNAKKKTQGYSTVTHLRTLFAILSCILYVLNELCVLAGPIKVHRSKIILAGK